MGLGRSGTRADPGVNDLYAGEHGQHSARPARPGSGRGDRRGHRGDDRRRMACQDRRPGSRHPPSCRTGSTDVLAAMDDAACAVDSSGLVIAASPAASRFGIEIGATLENPELRQLMRSVREGGSETQHAAAGSRRPATSSPRLVAARASWIGPRLGLLIIRDVTEQERLDQMRTRLRGEHQPRAEDAGRGGQPARRGDRVGRRRSRAGARASPPGSRPRPRVSASSPGGS